MRVRPGGDVVGCPRKEERWFWGGCSVGGTARRMRRYPAAFTPPLPGSALRTGDATAPARGIRPHGRPKGGAATTEANPKRNEAMERGLDVRLN
ncbi:hypothetical protein GCM10010388_31990 [Streptomyces mauvecolor]